MTRSPKTRTRVLGLAATALVVAMPAAARAATPEQPATSAATAVTGTSANLNGVLNPGAAATVGYHFLYGSGVTCGEGLETEQQPDVTGKAVPVTFPLAGLVGSTEYTFCVVATPKEGEAGFWSVGLPLTFTTLAAKPSVDSEGSAAVTPFGAFLEAMINPENQTAEECAFEYGPTTAYGGTTPCEPATLEGTTDQFVGARIAGLSPATIYHYRVSIKNGTGTTHAADSTFTTKPLEAPSLERVDTFSVGATDASLEAVVNVNFQDTTVVFEYSTSETLSGATTVPGGPTLPGELGEQRTPPIDLGNKLQPHTTYFYRAVATNATGTTVGGIHSFTTLDRPEVATGAVQAVTRSTATLSGTVDAVGSPTTFYFEYVDSTAYQAAVSEGAPNPYAAGRRTPASAEIGVFGAHPTGALQAIELLPGTTYHYALVATNEIGTTTSPDAVFTTGQPTPPTAETEDASDVADQSATLHGSVLEHGLATVVSFELHQGDSQGAIVPANVLSAPRADEAAAASLREERVLLPATTYSYRLIATNVDGTSVGAVRTFTTPGFAVAVGESTVLPVLPHLSIAELNAREAGRPTAGKKKTRAQRVAAALKRCRKQPKPRRAACRRRAQKLH
jgi:hypothetical protein